MIGSLGRILLLVASVLVVLTYFLVRAATPDAAQHERTLDALRSLLLSGAALERDVLSARAGLLRNYDPIVEAMRELRAAATVLAETAALRREQGESELRIRAEMLSHAVEEREKLVNEFRSRNAVLQNSLNFFAHASTTPTRPDAERPEDVAAAVAALANAMLVFLRDERPAAAAPVALALDRLAQLPASDKEPQRSLLLHGKVMLETLPAVSDMVARILASDVAAPAQAFHDRYLEQHARAERRAEAFRRLLYASAILLVAYLAFLFWRLRANAAALSARLGFERLIAEISADLINLPREKLDAAVENALMRLGRHLGASGAYALLGDPEHGGLKRSYGWFAGDAQPAPATLEEAYEAALERSDRVSGPPYCLRARGIKNWVCLSMSCAGRRFGFLVFESHERTSWRESDLALLGTAAEILANALDRERAQAEHETLEDRLRQAQRMEAIGTLAGGIAHEFNNTLGAILGYSEMALAALSPDDSARRQVQQVMTAGHRAKGVVDQILAFARRGSSERQPVRVRTAVMEALELLRVSLPPTIAMRTSLQATDAVVLADAGQLQQVVVNLCTNAAQAVQGRGTVDVTLDSLTFTEGATLSHGSLPEGDYLRLTVADNGTGIEAGVMDRLFEPFFTTKSPGEGTGLGLATVHGIVLRHGGALNVRSLRQGSVFEVYLPQLSDGSVPAATDAQPIPTGSGQTILLVDDEQPLVLLGEEMLAALGYEPVGSCCSEKALAAVRAAPHRFDLVLTDEVMPGMTGTELARAVHAVRPDLPIVLMTGYIGPAAASRLRDSGIREVLRKPLLTRNIAESLARHLHVAA